MAITGKRAPYFDKPQRIGAPISGIGRSILQPFFIQPRFRLHGGFIANYHFQEGLIPRRLRLSRPAAAKSEDFLGRMLSRIG